MGLLPITIEILPPPLQGVSLLPRSEISRIASKATAASNDAFRSFLTYAKAWWGEYRAIHPSFKVCEVELGGFPSLPAHGLPFPFVLVLNPTLLAATHETTTKKNLCSAVL